MDKNRDESLGIHVFGGGFGPRGRRVAYLQVN